MRRPFSVLVACAIALAGTPRSGWAHAILLQATPAPNATVEGPDVKVELKFNSRIDGKRSRIIVLMPDKSEKVLTNDAAAAPDSLTAQAHGLASGAYRLKWQVLSSDGHITRGEHPFTVK